MAIAGRDKRSTPIRKPRYPNSPKEWDAKWASEMVRLLQYRDEFDAAQIAAYTTTNASGRRTLDPTDPETTLFIVADVLAVLLEDLQNKGILSLPDDQTRTTKVVPSALLTLTGIIPAVDQTFAESVTAGAIALSAVGPLVDLTYDITVAVGGPLALSTAIPSMDFGFGGATVTMAASEGDAPTVVIGP